MKDSIATTIKQITYDKSVLTVLVTLGIVTIAFLIFFAATIKPSELQVSVQYSSFLGSFFERGQWTYLLSICLFGFMVGVLHGALIIKLFIERGRQAALVCGWATIAVLIVSALILSKIVAGASLS